MIARSMKGKILVFAVFFIGIATGVLLANFYDTRVTGSRPDAPTEREQRAQRDINKFYDYLGLNEEQRAQARKIGEETRVEFQNLRQETQPRFEAIQQESRTKIRALLTDEQRLKYDEFRKARDERFRNRNRDNREPKRDSSEKPN
jgi:Spy/CpxP family protein refolding chaperone